jgi:predicted RNA-binding Zn ribbon-like protein
MRSKPRVVQLQDARRQRFSFESASIALDFAYSGAGGRWAAFEVLHQPTDLQAWLLDCEWAVRLDRPVGEAAFDEAIALRESIREMLWAVAAGRSPEARDMERINEAALRPCLVPQCSGVGRAAWHEPTIEQVMSSLAREAIDVLCSVPMERIRSCAGEDCPLVYVDTSRPGNRRWCSMQRCGNRAKVRAFRKVD